MKVAGICIFVIGAIWALFAFNYETTVVAGGQSYGSGDYSVRVPEMRVQNIGLMDARRNHLMFAALAVLVGVVLFGFGSVSAQERLRPNGGMKSCPHCAELVKRDAKVCRYCGLNIESSTIDTHQLDGAKKTENFETEYDCTSRLESLGYAVTRNTSGWKIKEPEGRKLLLQSLAELAKYAKSEQSKVIERND